MSGEVESKFCPRCQVEKPRAEFHRNVSRPDGLQSACRACRNTAAAELYAANPRVQLDRNARSKERLRQEYEDYVWDYLTSHPCVDCGETDILVLQFDHRGSKKINVTMLYSHSMKVLIEEIEKCDIRCSNCHDRKTWIERDTWKVRRLRAEGLLA